ncbi:MAG TPA: ABC transporter substrate-binding protein [Candidatus Dormibacteraeota bacterium]|nr:ABC transporter substrate-binding protein [Candidatus Dormibacteraeota bacterium]
MRHRDMGRTGRPRWWGPLVAAMVAVVAAAACGGGASTTTTQQASGPPIKIGVLDDNAPLTAVEGAEMRVNTDLAIDQINRAGGIHGHPLQAVYADPKAQPDQAIALAQQLVQQQGVDVLVGAVLSSECLGVGNLVPRLQVVYVSSTGCAAEDFTGKQCNSYTFRVLPQGRQGVIPLATYIVNQYGKKWSIIYPDYAFGQSQLAAYRVGMQAAGGELSQIIAIPQNETNMTPYITSIKTDGSINGLINTEVGADLNRASQAIAQFNINQKMPIVGVFGKERFGGVYPDSLTGDIGQSPELSDFAKENKDDIAYHTAFRAELGKEDANIVQALGGADKAVPGDLGYEAYTAITALKEAMLSANFTGKADTAKLIKAMSTLKAKQGPDFPGGDMQMNPANHQGVATTYIAKINGQTEQVLATIAPAQLPSIGSCQVA